MSKQKAIPQDSEEDWCNLLLRKAPDVVIAINESDVIEIWNDQAEKKIGWSRSEALGKSLADLIIPPELAEAHLKGIKRFLETGEGQLLNKRIEMQALKKDGNVIPVEMIVVPILVQGKYKFYSFLVDLSERKKHEHEAETQRMHFSAIIGQTIVPIAQLDMAGKYLMVNDCFCDLIGRDRDQILTMTFREIIHPEDVCRHEEMVEEVKVSGKSFMIEERIITKDGKIKWINNSVSKIESKNNESYGLISLSLDITEKKIEARNRDLENQRMRFLSEAGVALNSSLDYRTTIKKITQLAVPLLGDWCYVHLVVNGNEVSLADVTSFDPLLNDDLNEFASILTRSGPNAVATCLKTQKVVHRENLDDDYYKTAALSPGHLELFRKLRPKGVIVAPLVSRGSVIGAITVSYCRSRSPYTAQDVELVEEVALRAALAIDNSKLFEQSQEAIKARDDFLAIASHELKTPVTSLKLQIQMIMRKLKNNALWESGKEYLEKTLSASLNHIDRMTKLIEDMLDISRLQHGRFKLNKQFFDLGELLLNILKNMEDQLQIVGINGKFQVEGSVNGNWDQMRIEQVIDNILSNAIKYAPGSPLDIRLTDMGDKVKLQIRDHGKGISKESLEKIFLCFERLTPRTEISGLGLGLYISRQIINAHKGKIWAESEPGEGATFCIELPKE